MKDAGEKRRVGGKEKHEKTDAREIRAPYQVFERCGRREDLGARTAKSQVCHYASFMTHPHCCNTRPISLMLGQVQPFIGFKPRIRMGVATLYTNKWNEVVMELLHSCAECVRLAFVTWGDRFWWTVSAIGTCKRCAS